MGALQVGRRSMVVCAGLVVRPDSDIFFWTVSGRQEAASVLALLQTALVMAGYVMARLLLGRAPRNAI